MTASRKFFFCPINPQNICPKVLWNIQSFLNLHRVLDDFFLPLSAEQVDFSADRFALCFKASYGRGADNDCILMSGGTADRGDLSVLTKEIPTGSGVHKLLPTLKSAGKCVNVIPLKDSNMSQVSFPSVSESV